MRNDATYRHELMVHRVKLRKTPNKAEAVKRGARYYLGKPCKHGHFGERYTSNGRCVNCVAARKIKYKRKDHLPNTSKSIAIDHIMDNKEQDYWDDM